MRAYVGLTVDHEALLRDFWPALEPHADRVIDHFYEKVIAFEASRQVLKDEAQVHRLRVSLRRWLEDTICGTRDAQYVARRTRIGEVHVQVGLEARYMNSAIAVLVADLHQVACGEYPAEKASQVCDVVNRAMMIDLAMMTSSYVVSRDREQLAALNRVLVTHLQLVVLLTDADDRVVACTPATRALGDGADPIGRGWSEALPPKLVAAGELRQVREDVARGQKPVTVPRVDMGARSFRVHFIPLDNDLAALLIQVEELTDALQLEARVRRAESLAQLGSLSAAVAHELRNPLAGIRGAIQVIAAGLPEGDPSRAIMGKIEGEVDRLNQLVTDLLSYARPREPGVDELELRGLVERVVELADCDIAPTIVGQGRALGDADQVRQILLNLLQNARQTGASEVRIDVDDGQITVSDAGPGVPEEDAARIFEPFVTTKSRGTGLGLAISRSAATSMRGRLELCSRGALAGAAFRLTLPTASKPPSTRHKS